MTGGEGDLKGCTAGSVEGIGEEVPSCGKFLNPVSECTTKMKAEEEASGCAAAAAVAKAESAAGDEPRKPQNRMSNREIRWILAHKPSDGPSHYRTLKESNPDLIPSPEEEMDESRKNLYCVAKLFYEMEESYPKLQEWVRQELETKGYVELDDDWARRRAENQAVVEEAWKRFEAMLQSETEDDGDDDSDDDEEEDDF